MAFGTLLVFYFLAQTFQYTGYRFQHLTVVVAQEKDLILTLTLQLCDFTNLTRVCYWLVVISHSSCFQTWTGNGGL